MCSEKKKKIYDVVKPVPYSPSDEVSGYIFEEDQFKQEYEELSKVRHHLRETK